MRLGNMLVRLGYMAIVYSINRGINTPLKSENVWGIIKSFSSNKNVKIDKSSHFSPLTAKSQGLTPIMLINPNCITH